MRICHIVNIGHEVGGAEKSVRLLAEGMRARGHDVMVICSDHRFDPEATFADVVVPAAAGNALSRLTGFFWNRAAYAGVRDAVTGFAPDVVHLHTIGMFSPSVLSATAAFPRVLTVHGPEDWTLGLLTWNLASRSAKNSGLSIGDRARYAYLRFLQRPAYRLRLRTVDRILVPSEFYRSMVIRDVGAVPLYVVPNGIRLPQATPVRNDGRLLYVGRLERVKGVEILVMAFVRTLARHPDAQLVVVGDGPIRAELVRLAEDPGAAGRVHLTGWLSGQELEEQYAAASVVVIPSIFPDNFPTVAIEALGSGRAVVGSRVGGIPELVHDGDNGLLTAADDIEELESALDRMLGDPALVRRMGNRSAALAATYAIDPFLDRLQVHYEAVLPTAVHQP